MSPKVLRLDSGNTKKTLRNKRVLRIRMISEGDTEEDTVVEATVVEATMVAEVVGIIMHKTGMATGTTSSQKSLKTNVVQQRSFLTTQELGLVLQADVVLCLLQRKEELTTMARKEVLGFTLVNL